METIKITYPKNYVNKLVFLKDISKNGNKVLKIKGRYGGGIYEYQYGIKNILRELETAPITKNEYLNKIEELIGLVKSYYDYDFIENSLFDIKMSVEYGYSFNTDKRANNLLSENQIKINKFLYHIFEENGYFFNFTRVDDFNIFFRYYEEGNYFQLENDNEKRNPDVEIFDEGYLIYMDDKLQKLIDDIKIIGGLK